MVRARIDDGNHQTKDFIYAHNSQYLLSNKNKTKQKQQQHKLPIICAKLKSRYKNVYCTSHTFKSTFACWHQRRTSHMYINYNVHKITAALVVVLFTNYFIIAVYLIMTCARNHNLFVVVAIESNLFFL